MFYDIVIRIGIMVRFECVVIGYFNFQIVWQKDGGIDFFVVRERRMYVMLDDDVFFIIDVKIDDMGVYSCIVQNLVGFILVNVILIVLGLIFIY